ncbi:MAG: MoaD/ThiS family protein [Bilophila wadsworthia]
MMKLTVKCFATLMPLTPPGGSLEFHGTDICDLLRQLSIPESEARIIFVNGIGVEKDALLHDGDRVGIFPRGRRVISVFAQYVELACRAKRVSAVFWLAATPVRRSAVFVIIIFRMASLLKKGGAGLLHEASAHTGAGIDARARFFRRGEPLPFLWRASLNGETIWRIRMESSMYWLDLIAETYIGICVLCCLFIISKQRRRPAL